MTQVWAGSVLGELGHIPRNHELLWKILVCTLFFILCRPLGYCCPGDLLDDWKEVEDIKLLILSISVFQTWS